jgi:hypothetical protein
MQIIKITKKHIYCYIDYTFVIFDCNKLIIGAQIVGVSWAAGKAPKSPFNAPLDEIRKDTCYHNMITMTLINYVEDKYVQTVKTTKIEDKLSHR